MNTADNIRQTLRDFVQSHSQELAEKLRMESTEAAHLLEGLGFSLCQRLFPDQQFQMQPRQPQPSEFQRSLESLQQIIDHLSEGVVIADMAGNLLDWNPAALRLHGFGSVTEVRRNLSSFDQQFELSEPGGPPLPPEEWPLARLLRGRPVSGWELICRRLDTDQVRYIRYGSTIIPDPQGRPQFALLMLYDLTDQYQAHMEQQKLSRLLQAVSEATRDALFVKDLEGRYTWLNQATAQFVGLPVEQVLGKDDSHWFDTTSVEMLQRRQHEIQRKGVAETREETLTIGAETRTFLATKAPYLDELGQLAGIIGISRDVTAQKLAEKQLNDSESLLRAIIDNAQAVIWVKSLDGRFRIVNQYCCRCWQRSQADILGRTAHDLFPAAQAAEQAQHEAGLLAGGEPLEVQETIQLDNEWKTFYSVKFALLSPEGEIQALASISTDITSSKRLEQQFWQAQKMEAIGRLAGGVAHDFNNQLTIILGNCDLVLESLEAQNPDRELLQEVYRAGERTARLTRQLLAFSRMAVTAPTQVDLNTLVTDTALILEGLVRDSVRCELQLGPEVGPIQGDANQLEQLLMNLVSNASDAMPQGGTITLTTSLRTLETPFAGLSPGRFAVLSVSDTGAGVGAEIRDRIFDPFFTTKELGQGTGLGLAVAHGIMEQLGGAIQVDSQEGVGASFHCWFPALKTKALPEADPTELPLTGTETILLIEDEAGVRKVARMALEAKGYTVLEAASGAEAIHLLSDYGGPLHCILSDVAMPGMNGPQTVEAIGLERPGLPVVFMSGYVDESVISREELAAGAGFVQKPFSPLSLARTIRQVLDSKGV